MPQIFLFGIAEWLVFQDPCWALSAGRQLPSGVIKDPYLAEDLKVCC